MTHQNDSTYQNRKGSYDIRRHCFMRRLDTIAPPKCLAAHSGLDLRVHKSAEQAHETIKNATQAARYSSTKPQCNSAAAPGARTAAAQPAHVRWPRWRAHRRLAGSFWK
eukprot:6173256-Pleurochrysis_carterae.AAC.2